MSTQTRKYEKRVRAETQEQTRQQIAKAAAELHAKVGPAETTVAEIARRAGVSRLTVYNHFPDGATLYPACSAHWMGEHPLPDLESAFAEDHPRDRVRAALLLAYADWYRAWGSMMRNLQRDRGRDPILDKMMRNSSDAALDQLADGLAQGFKVKGAHQRRMRSMIRLALDFWTWRRLDAEGLDDREAADLMADAIAAMSYG